MTIGITVIMCSLLYSSMVAIVYFSKKRINNVENKIYGLLVKINIFGLLLELLCCYFVYNATQSVLFGMLNVLVNKLFLVYLLVWEFIFTGYVFFISFNDRKELMAKLTKNKSKLSFLTFVFFSIIMILMIYLPLYYHNDGVYVYSYGPATDLLMIMGGLFIGIDIFCVVKNIKNIKNKKYYPLFSLVLLMIVVLLIRKINPGLILINSTFAFVTMFMYHTIENPDILLIEELYKNKTLVEEANEEKSNFLFNIAQEIRNYVKQIITISNDSLKEKNKENMLLDLKEINNNAKQLDYTLNNILDVSTIDSKSIKIMQSKYNTYNMFEEIKVRTKPNIKNNVELRFDICNNLPRYLYGDALKLKQVLFTIFNHSALSTKEGFVSFNVNVIEKYDVCRLLITIEDSGKGLSIDEVNDILKSDTTIDDTHITKLDQLDLKTCRKVINIMGGAMMVKSEENHGTKVTITIDQKIVEASDEKQEKLKYYDSFITRDKKILVVDDNALELKNIKDYLNNYDFNISTTMYGKDCLDKIESGSKYELIILDDNLKDYSALNIMKDIKSDKKNNMPIIVMLDNKKLSIKEHYLSDGFNDIILKDKLYEELDRIVKKY